MPKRIMSWEVSDDLWEHVEALLPAEMARTKVKRGERWRAGRPPADRRKTFAGIVYVLRTGCQWKAVPRKYGNGSSIHRYFQKWAKAGVFSQMWLAGLPEYDEMEGIEWKWQSIDGAMVKAPLGGEASGPNPTDRAAVPGTTFANSIGIAHKGSGGMSSIFPDVCKTPSPAGPIPIPYPNIGKSGDTSGGPSSVKTDGQMPMTKGAKYMMSAGDEAGAAMGVISSKIKGACEFMMYSFDVKFEGQNVCRLGDPLFHNEKNGTG